MREGLENVSKNGHNAASEQATYEEIERKVSKTNHRVKSLSDLPN